MILSAKKKSKRKSLVQCTQSVNSSKSSASCELFWERSHCANWWVQSNIIGTVLKSLDTHKYALADVWTFFWNVLFFVRLPFGLLAHTSEIWISHYDLQTIDWFHQTRIYLSVNLCSASLMNQHTNRQNAHISFTILASLSFPILASLSFPLLSEQHFVIELGIYIHEEVKVAPKGRE